MKRFIDRYYRFIRPFRPLYGWAKDSHTKAKCSKRAFEWQAKGFEGAKLDICGGRNPYKPGEFLNCDMVDFPGVDLTFDLREQFPFKEGVISEIISVATLEHLRKPHVDHVLQEFFRILQLGGVLRVSTPDIEAIAESLLEGNEDIHVINQHLFGKYKGNTTEDLDLHKWMYPADEMIKVLQKLGFVNAKKVHMDIGLHDPKYNYLIRAEKH